MARADGSLRSLLARLSRILDRLVHNAHRTEMRGASMPRNRGKPNSWP